MAFLLPATGANAIPNTPVVYAHGIITLQPAAQSTLQKTEGDNAAENSATAPSPDTPERLPLELRANIHPMQALYRQGIYARTPYMRVQAWLFIADSPLVLQVRTPAFTVPSDILALDHEGRVIQIFPAIVPSEAAQHLLYQSPVMALLYLPGNFVAEHAIVIGDQIVHRAFMEQ